MLMDWKMSSFVGLMMILSGCSPSFEGAPDRMFTVNEEIAFVKAASNPSVYRDYMNASGSEKLAIRNRFVFARMYGIDQLYSEYEASLTTERQKAGFYTAIAQLGINGAGAIVGGEQAKTVLHAVATGLTGAKQAYSNEVLIEKTIDILQKNMRANRKTTRARIIKRLAGDISVYPLELALTDLEEYYRAGTITGAFIGVSDDASLRLELAKTTEEQAINGFLEDDLTERINRFYNSSKENKNKVLAWLDDKLPYGDLVYNSAYLHLRTQIIRELGIP